MISSLNVFMEQSVFRACPFNANSFFKVHCHERALYCSSTSFISPTSSKILPNTETHLFLLIVI